MRLTISRPSRVRTLSGRLGNQSAPPLPPAPFSFVIKSFSSRKNPEEYNKEVITTWPFAYFQLILLIKSLCRYLKNYNYEVWTYIAPVP